MPLGCNRVFSVCVGVWCFGLCFRCIKRVLFAILEDVIVTSECYSIMWVCHEGT